MKRLIILFCMLLAMASLALAQRDIEAKTSDGRTVVLKTDGTWSFGKSTTATGNSDGSINIEAAMIFKNGDVVPIARTKFYLLPKDALEVLGTSELLSLYSQDCGSLSASLCKASPAVSDLLTAFNYGILYPKFTAAALPKLEAAAISTLVTDFTGKGSFSKLPVGEYFIVGMATIRKGRLAWNQKVAVSSASPVQIVLDPNNGF